MSIWDELNDNQMAAVNYKLQHPSCTYAEISRAIGVSEGTVSNWGLNEIVRTILSERRQKTEELIERSSIEAVRTLQLQLSDDDHKVAQGAAKLLLAYYLGNPTTPVKVDANLQTDVQLFDLRHLSFEQLLELKQAGK